MINNKYQILEQIGSGAFGKIFRGVNIRNNENVAIKSEPIDSESALLLKNETIFYEYLKELKHVPKIKWFGKDSTNYYMVMELLGISLGDLKKKAGKLPLELVQKIGIQLILILQSIHSKGLVHRDIKPDNFLLGLNNQKLFLIDFGFCKSFDHSERKTTKKLIGTLNYASLNAHRLYDQSRADDLESLCYTLTDLSENGLVWDKRDESEIIQYKENFITLPVYEQLKQLWNYIQHIGYDETPNYQMIINILKHK